MSVGATEAELANVEHILGLRLPAEHRAMLSVENGWERWYGDCFVMMYDTAYIVGVNQVIERHPGFLAIGSDGSREQIGFDTRREPPPVVLIDITSPGWESAIHQADSLEDFMRQRARGEDFRWDAVE